MEVPDPRRSACSRGTVIAVGLPDRVSDRVVDHPDGGSAHHSVADRPDRLLIDAGPAAADHRLPVDRPAGPLFWRC
jgi:hypothetical protein